MTVYTVHAPAEAASASGASARAEDYVFVRDGFHFWAFVFGPFWLLWHRLWLALLLYVVAAVGFAALLAWLNAPADARSAAWFLLAILLGLEAASLKRWSYSRGRWRQIDVVVAAKGDSAERRFFDRWHGPQAAPASRAATAPITPAHFYGANGPEVIGSFPRSERAR